MIKNMYSLFSIIISLIAISSAEIKHLSNYVNVCHKSDPDLSNCILKSIESLRPKLIEGIPDIDVPALEPLYLGDLMISKKQQNNIDISIKNLKVYNAGTFQIKKLQNKNYLESVNAEILLPKFNIDGNYSMDGSLLALPLKGTGQIRGNFTNISAKIKFLIEKEQINNQEFYNIKSIKIKVRMGNGKLRLDNLFGNNKGLNDVINESINGNIDGIAKELMPSIERTLEAKFTEIGNIIFHLYTTDQILPE